MNGDLKGFFVFGVDAVNGIMRGILNDVGSGVAIDKLVRFSLSGVESKRV